MIDYSIIIPAYNEAALLPATLAALAESMAAFPERRGEIIVADNASTDNTAELAQAAGARVVHEAHRQIAAARNAGAAVARGHWLIFVDADSTIPVDLLRATFTALERPDIIGGGALPVFPGIQNRFARLAMWTWSVISRRFKFACGAYLFCRRVDFVAVGGFDKRYYAGEELALSFALRMHGRRQRPRQRVIILKPTFITSDRKLQWHSKGKVLRLAFGFLLRPWAMRRRAACDFWYDRPATPVATIPAVPAAPLPSTSDPGSPPR